MKIAIMQPYFFPYVGYYEMFRDVDKFIFYDTAQYIRRGWCHRNRIKSSTGWQYVRLPVCHSPQKTPIKDILLAENDWIGEICKRLTLTYGCNSKKHPIYSVFEKFQSMWTAGERHFRDYACQSVVLTAEILGISHPDKWIYSSQFADDKPMQRIEKIISLCQCLGADSYINLPGGVDIYDATEFANAGIKLEFQPKTTFFNNLSILDLCLGDELRCL